MVLRRLPQPEARGLQVARVVEEASDVEHLVRRFLPAQAERGAERLRGEPGLRRALVGVGADALLVGV
ncbi:MAG TPA: hypothetical protein VFQ39_06675 [Longimicrobium sp.]|nr:hypothetical protein [Longimicrobium sp.]